MAGPRYEKSYLYPVGFNGHESLVYTCEVCGYKARTPTLDADKSHDASDVMRLLNERGKDVP